MRFCLKCQKNKPLTQFGKDMSKKDNLTQWCKFCRYAKKEEWLKQNRDGVREYQKNNSEQISKRMKIYNQRPEVKERAESRRQERYRKNPALRAFASFTAQINRALRGGKNQTPLRKVLGYSVNDLKKHLEDKFESDMSWDNYGLHGWHIDHIIPQSYFKYSSIKDKNFRKCWELSNLQPKWAKDNFSKGNRYIG